RMTWNSHKGDTLIAKEVMRLSKPYIGPVRLEWPEITVSKLGSARDIATPPLQVIYSHPVESAVDLIYSQIRWMTLWITSAQVGLTRRAAGL
ncbi:hypothetical protein, partial [Pseudomonas savastanoi]